MILKNICKKNIVFFIILALGLFLSPNFALAQVAYNALVNIPGIPDGVGVTAYLSGLYNFLVSVVGIVAMGAIVIGGVRYLTSVGNPSAIEDAKRTIYSAIYGLILVITSWVIVSTINPDILVLKNPEMGMPTGVYTSGVKTPQCALATGSPLTGCVCADGKTIKEKTPVPFYVVSASTPTCSTDVPVAMPKLIFTFSDNLDSATVVAGNFVSIGGTFTFTVAIDPLDNKNAILTLVAPSVPLATPGNYQLRISSNIKSASGVNLAHDYFWRITTGAIALGACTPYPAGNGCNRVCSDSAFAEDTSYHCIKADLRVGKTLKTADSKSVWGKKDEILYFDLDTNSIHNKSIVRYEVDYDNDFLGSFVSDVGCTVSAASWCVFPIPTTPCNGAPTFLNHQYTTPGVYKVWAKIYDEECNPSEDIIDVTIENL